MSRDKCPGCGALVASRNPSSTRFLCGTWDAEDIDEAKRSDLCCTLEELTATKRKLASSEARVKHLRKVVAELRAELKRERSKWLRLGMWADQQINPRTTLAEMDRLDAEWLRGGGK